METITKIKSNSGDMEDTPILSDGVKEKSFVTLKWGTLKSWRMTSEKGKDLLKDYHTRGSSLSAMDQKDTPEQKQIICAMIDECDGDEIYLDWDGKYVSKAEAKEYVLNYNRS